MSQFSPEGQQLLKDLGIRDEQAEHEAFEELVGGPDRGFRLMRLYESAKVCGDKRLEVFEKFAKRDGYTTKQITAFLELP